MGFRTRILIEIMNTSVGNPETGLEAFTCEARGSLIKAVIVDKRTDKDSHRSSPSQISLNSAMREGDNTVGKHVGLITAVIDALEAVLNEERTETIVFQIIKGPSI
jgi:hypothetical protein